MRHSVLVVAGLVMIALGSIGCQQSPESPAERASEIQAGTRTITVPVNGMICQICAGRVRSALQAVHGVQDVEISLVNRNAVIRYADGALDVDKVTSAITEAGFKTGPPTLVERQ